MTAPDPLDLLARELGAETRLLPIDVENLRRRIQADRANYVPGSNVLPVAVFVDSNGPAYGVFRWRFGDPMREVTRFGQPDWR